MLTTSKVITSAICVPVYARASDIYDEGWMEDHTIRIPAIGYASQYRGIDTIICRDVIIRPPTRGGIELTLSTRYPSQGSTWAIRVAQTGHVIASEMSDIVSLLNRYHTTPSDTFLRDHNNHLMTIKNMMLQAAENTTFPLMVPETTVPTPTIPIDLTCDARIQSMVLVNNDTLPEELADENRKKYLGGSTHR